jgi:hypothetical protein
MLTPDSPDRLYSTRLRTAVVITGTGTAGAYHAGVLRALHEAGVRIDLVAGRGVGVIGALFSAVDGGARLWEADGIWKRADAQRFYGWRAPLRAAGWALAVAALILAFPIALLALAVLTGLAGFLLALVGLEGTGATVTAAYGRWIASLFAPGALPTYIPRLVLLAVLIAVVALAAGALTEGFSKRERRRRRHGGVWRVLGAPLTTAPLLDRCGEELWNLIRGVAPLAIPQPPELARRYVELLTENLGQPGFREVLITVHDLDARRDLVFGVIAQAHRARFFGRTVLGDAAARQAEAFDLTGVARDYALDALAAALSVPIATEPHLIRFSPEGAWRGETHRVCDRGGSLARLLEEVSSAGVEQVVLVAAAAPSAQANELSAGRVDPKGRAGEQLVAFESAGLRDALEHFAGRVAGLYVVRPAHNPLGPLDFGGVFDERSDRIHTVAELVDRGYEDAYRQFIEPVVAASGERIETVQQ